jgi:hypothetical protein
MSEGPSVLLGLPPTMYRLLYDLEAEPVASGSSAPRASQKITEVNKSLRRLGAGMDVPARTMSCVVSEDASTHRMTFPANIPLSILCG